MGLFSALLLSASCVWSAPAIERSEYKQRRADLRKKLDGPMVLFGRTEGKDEVFRLGQEPNFYYLTGFTEPGAVLLLTRYDETLLLPKRNERRETFNGKRWTADDPGVREGTGVDRVLAIEKFESALAKAMESGPALYALTDATGSARLKQLAPLRDLDAAAPLIAALRVQKSVAEIAAITRTTQVTEEAQRAAWKRIKPGIYEYQAVATFTGALLEAGCEGYSYAPIFGSGPNATVLHYNASTRRMDAGEVMVIDAAAQCDAYASDVTRTVPVNGKFTPRQKELYEIVLGAQKAAIAAIKPGVAMADLTKIAKAYIDSHGKDLKGQSLGKYLPHGVSHHVGLDVHDPGVIPGTLAAGMVITVEPGIYIPEESIGIRIEDVILVTENGAKILSTGLPRESDEVEKAMAR